MSDFEYSDLSSGGSGDEESVIAPPCKTKKNPDKISKCIQINKELRLYYSNLFNDTFILIDLFVKGNILTYDAFLAHFTSMKFHQIYGKRTSDIKQIAVTPHHYITTAQDALAVASKFLRSRSRNARIGAVYLLYTLYHTQPIHHYSINVKMEPQDYHNTKELVNKCLFENILHPSYCFYELDMKKRISITANTVNPCLEANYPRDEIRKHLGRVADHHFAVVYEKRRDFDPSTQLQLMEDQIRKELTYINKLSNLSLEQDVVMEYKPELSKVLVEINMAKIVNTPDHQNNKIITGVHKDRYKNNKKIAFPGKNEDVLHDMVVIAEPSNPNEPTVQCHPRKKLKMSKRKIKNNYVVSPVKNQPPLPKLSDVLDSDSSISSTENEELYDQMIMQFLDDDDNDGN